MIDQETKVERLNQLLRVCGEAPDDLFHMRVEIEDAPCGTARCLAGWAYIDPWFEEQGIEGAFSTDARGELPDKIWIDWPAMENFFGLTPEEAHKLFGGDLNAWLTKPHEVSKEEVADNIRCAIAGKPLKFYKAALRMRRYNN